MGYSASGHEPRRITRTHAQETILLGIRNCPIASKGAEHAQQQSVCMEEAGPLSSQEDNLATHRALGQDLSLNEAPETPLRHVPAQSPTALSQEPGPWLQLHPIRSDFD